MSARARWWRTHVGVLRASCDARATHQCAWCGPGMYRRAMGRVHSAATGWHDRQGNQAHTHTHKATPKARMRRHANHTLQGGGRRALLAPHQTMATRSLKYAKLDTENKTV